MRKTFVVMIVVSALVGVGCSSDKASGGRSSPGGCTADNATDLTGDNPFTITIKDFAYHPSCFKAKSSASITIQDQDSVTHTFTITGTPIDVSITAGQTFNGESAGLAPGTYQVRCTIHPQMTGTVFVS